MIHERVKESFDRPVLSGISLDVNGPAVDQRQMNLLKFPSVIGREESSGIQLSGLLVGRQHATLRMAPEGVMLHDHGTLVGTHVNGLRITEYGPLRRDDQIQIGGWSLRVADLLEEAGTDVGHDQSLVDRAVSQLRKLIDLRRKDWQGVADSVVRRECRELLAPIANDLLGTSCDEVKTRFMDRVIAESVGLGPLEALFQDAEISEIMVNRFDEIYIEKRGVCERADLRFSGEESVRAVIDRIVSPLGRRIDDASPMVDARLADGSRVNAVIRPLAVKGASLTIRRFMNRLLSPQDLIDRQSATPEILNLLELAVRYRFNIVVSGGTGSGKTTLLNLLSQWIPQHERVITIEDAAELRLNHPNLVSLEVRQENAEGHGKVTIRDLLRNSLRMRPDRIIVGECRGGESLDMLQAMNTGHEGSLTTVHANNPRDALSRLEVMVMMAGFELPLGAIREQIASAVDLVVQQQRCPDGSRRIFSLMEVTGVESGVIQTQEIVRWRPDLQRFIASGVVPHCVELMLQRGIALDLPSLLGADGSSV
jgi:pilus assembly protein CpaF